MCLCMSICDFVLQTLTCRHRLLDAALETGILAGVSTIYVREENRLCYRTAVSVQNTTLH